ncbi:MAG: 23S rRNA (uracil(1939)-C(5))-methyltransferase RlmD [Clostridia bacterium]|nr:23S rRNA (uracil(1939)-C(5))-methyltransferase RlmD [Clostridia bacterium]
MKKNDIVEIFIDGITHDGSGVGRFDNMVIFVPETMLGDRILCHILKVNKNIAFGKVSEFIEKSKDRITPDCEIFRRCGSCCYRHINYESELKIKKQKIYDAMRKIAKIDMEPFETLPSPEKDFYRNKSQFPVSEDKEGKAVFGYYAKRSHDIIKCHDCKLIPPVFIEIANFVTNFWNENNLKPYNEKTLKGLLRNIYIRRGDATGEIALTLVLNGEKFPLKEKFVEEAVSKFSHIKTIVINVNKENTNVILGKKNIVIYGKGNIEDILCRNRFEISPMAFYQVNSKQTEKLYNLALSFADLDKEKKCVDLYCGIGTITLAAAKKAKEVIGIEIVPEAIENAKKNAELNNIENAKFICADAGQGAKKLADMEFDPDVIIVDPPRKGLDGETIDAICRMNPEKIVYISCDIGTAARDVEILSKRGYKLKKYQGVDMFPRTYHVETVILLSR